LNESAEQAATNFVGLLPRPKHAAADFGLGNGPIAGHAIHSADVVIVPLPRHECRG